MRELTRNRAALLRLFYTNPDQSYYMQELGRILNKKPGYFQRTLNKMAEEGILVSESRVNARYFKANKNYPLYEELKSIVFKTIGVLGSLQEIVHEVGIIKYCFIYGSYAKGKETSLSDIDLVIIGDVDEDKLIKDIDNLEEVIRREVNYKLYTMREFSSAIRKESPFILGILRDKKIMVIGDEDELRKIS